MDETEAESSRQDSDAPSRPPETLPEKATPDYAEDESIAYLAYILKETELIRARTEAIRRNTSVIIALLALAIIVLIIIWLDITGAITIF